MSTQSKHETAFGYRRKERRVGQGEERETWRWACCSNMELGGVSWTGGLAKLVAEVCFGMVASGRLGLGCMR